MDRRTALAAMASSSLAVLSGIKAIDACAKTVEDFCGDSPLPPAVNSKFYIVYVWHGHWVRKRFAECHVGDIVCLYEDVTELYHDGDTVFWKVKEVTVTTEIGRDQLDLIPYATMTKVIYPRLEDFEKVQQA